MPWRDGQPANSGDVTGKGEFERAGSEVPDLDRTIAGSGSEPLVTRLHGEGADPAEVAGDDAEELPGRTPLRFLLADCVAANQASRRCVALRRRSVGVGWEFSTSCALYAGQGCRCAVCLYLLSGSRCACVLDHLGHLRVARCSSVFGFFFRAARPACAFACFAASAAGNSPSVSAPLRSLSVLGRMVTGLRVRHRAVVASAVLMVDQTLLQRLPACALPIGALLLLRVP